MIGTEDNQTNDKGYAKNDEPAWAPPESQPEPMPTEPVMDKPEAKILSPKSNPTTAETTPRI